MALAYAESHQLPIAPQVTLYLVLLELPAIMVGLALFRYFDRSNSSAQSRISLLHETLTNRGVVLLIGGVIIGYLYGPMEGAPVTDLFTHAFKAVLALFLLEMGLTAAENLRPIPFQHWRLLCFALLAPACLALLGMATAAALGLTAGGALILASLTASASYIAAPAAFRAAVPQAHIGLAMLASLGVTFPFNVIVGIPLYHHLMSTLIG